VHYDLSLKLYLRALPTRYALISVTLLSSEIHCECFPAA
jgi:hypothetical protein